MSMATQDEIQLTLELLASSLKSRVELAFLMRLSKSNRGEQDGFDIELSR